MDFIIFLMQWKKLLHTIFSLLADSFEDDASFNISTVNWTGTASISLSTACSIMHSAVVFNFCQNSENIMHELVPHHQMLQDSLHSFIFSILMQKQFLQASIFNPAITSWGKLIDKQIIFLLHELKMVMQSETFLPFSPASIMQNLK